MRTIAILVFVLLALAGAIYGVKRRDESLTARVTKRAWSCGYAQRRCDTSLEGARELECKAAADECQGVDLGEW